MSGKQFKHEDQNKITLRLVDKIFFDKNFRHNFLKQKQKKIKHLLSICEKPDILFIVTGHEF